MANSNYGIIRPADMSPSDVEIFYYFTPDRAATTDEITLTKLDSTEILKKIDHPEDTGRIFGGLYNLKLPAATFGSKGIYTLVFKPTEIRTKIVDCGILSARPDIKGIVLDTSTVESKFRSKFTNGNLNGYRIEYSKPDSGLGEKKLQNLFRIVTSSNRAEPVAQNLNNTTQKSLTYRFNNNSSLMFLTLTPSTATTINPNVNPFIGLPGQEIILTNTFFDPFTLEIEMTEHDEDTLAIGLFGNQIRSIEDGKLTYYTPDNEIYKQFNLYDIRNKFTDDVLYEVREEITDIDTTKKFNIITNV